MYQEQRQLKKGKMGEEMFIFSSNESANGFKTPLAQSADAKAQSGLTISVVGLRCSFHSL
jgi:hypothetical protein